MKSEKIIDKRVITFAMEDSTPFYLDLHMYNAITALTKSTVGVSMTESGEVNF